MIKKWNKFNESDYWKSQEKEGKMRKSLRLKLSLLGRKVKVKGRGKWEEGTIVVDSFDDEDPEYFVMYSKNDLEQLCGLDFRIYNEEENKWEEDSNEIVMFFDLTDEEKEFLNLNEPGNVLTTI